MLFRRQNIAVLAGLLRAQHHREWQPVVERRKSKPGEVVPCVRGSSAGASPLRSAHPPHPRHELPRLPQSCEGCQPTHIPGLGRRMSSLRPVPRYPKREHYPTLLEARRTDCGAPHGQEGRVAGSGDCHERMPSTLPDLRSIRTQPLPYLRRRSRQARASVDEKQPTSPPY